MSRLVKVAVATAFVFAAVPASAATVLTFDGSNDTINPYIESGFVVDDTGFNIASDGALHIDIAYGPNPDNRTLKREDGEAFDVHGLDIISLFPSVSAGGLTDAPRDDMRFFGYSGTTLVAEASASSQFGDMTKTFGNDFAGLTSFVIKGFNAGNVDLDLFRDVHFLIDNIVVSDPGAEDDPVVAVPLPAGGLALLLALATIGSLKMRASRAA